MKRMPKDVVDHLIDRAQLSAIDDKDVREQYKDSKSWQR